MKNLRPLAFTVVLLLLAAFVSNAQTYAVPGKVRLETAAKREFRKWHITPARYPGLIPEQFFPIGWSKDGKFAYYYEPVDEACGCYFANLVIQDMRTDKVLYEFKYSGDDHADAQGNMPPEDTVAKLWRKNAKLFSEKLREHAIVAGRSVLLGKTFSAARSSYTAKAIVKMGKNPDWDELRVDKLTFTLVSPKLGSKSLYTADHSKEEYWFMLDAAVLGIIKSPFEDRVAVIGMTVNRGWEGPPHAGDIVIVGADLTSGFGKHN
jgi:hypothetical protein